MVFFGLISMNLLFSDQADWFARLGSAMIAWAIINLSTARERYDGAIVRGDRLRTVRHLNQMRELDRLREESLNVTFDIHASQIAQLAHALDKPNPFVENDPEKIAAFCAAVEERWEASTVDVDSKALVEQLSKQEDSYQHALSQNDFWGKAAWRMEFILLVWGTIQWGYGDVFVTWVNI